MHEIIQTSIMITAFVMLMMLVIEYVNVQTKGQWDKPLRRKKWLQIVVAALLGAVPGCLGVYTVVSLFTHKVVSFGALVSAMIATSGDEAFVMFAMIPKQAIWVSLVIFVVAIAAGFITNMFYKNVSFSKEHDHHFDIHHTEKKCKCFDKKVIAENFKHLSFTRSLILTGLIFFMVLLFIGNDHHNHSFSINQEVFSEPVVKELESNNKLTELRFQEFENEDGHEHNHEHFAEDSETTEAHANEHNHEAESQFNLPKIIFILLSLLALFIIVTVPNHFIEEHAWNHVIKKHFLKIFLWTFGTLLLIFLAKNYVNFDMVSFAKDNLWLILIFAILVGIIPESGPHMIFISLFATGVMPLSILMANSIVQDGHGALPLFAENKKAFVHMKLINMAVGLLVGALGIFFGF